MQRGTGIRPYRHLYRVSRYEEMWLVASLGMVQRAAFLGSRTFSSPDGGMPALREQHLHLHQIKCLCITCIRGMLCSCIIGIEKIAQLIDNARPGMCCEGASKLQTRKNKPPTHNLLHAAACSRSVS